MVDIGMDNSFDMILAAIRRTRTFGSHFHFYLSFPEVLEEIRLCKAAMMSERAC